MAVIRTKSYSIMIANDAFINIKEHLKGFDGKVFYLLVDARVLSLYDKTITNSFSDLDYTIVSIPEGESSKSFSTLENTIQQLIDKQIKRNDVIIALGGGVVGDLAGLVAALLFRGIDYIQIPTTLLSMVDSSIGGKTAINISQGKNLVGAFYMPKKVIIDPVFLKTLEEAEYLSGLSEILKAGLIHDAELLHQVKTQKFVDETMIERAINVKLDYVKKDPFDKNIRHILNFGHTFGHAIEKYYDYKIPHGEAVAQGIIKALELGVKLSLTPQKLLEEVTEVIKEKALVRHPIPDSKELYPYLSQDKKSTHDGIRFILLEDYQKPSIQRLSWEVFR